MSNVYSGITNDLPRTAGEFRAAAEILQAAVGLNGPVRECLDSLSSQQSPDNAEMRAEASLKIANALLSSNLALMAFCIHACKEAANLHDLSVAAIGYLAEVVETTDSTSVIRQTPVYFA